MCICKWTPPLFFHTWSNLSVRVSLNPPSAHTHTHTHTHTNKRLSSLQWQKLKLETGAGPKRRPDDKRTWHSSYSLHLWERLVVLVCYFPCCTEYKSPARLFISRSVSVICPTRTQTDGTNHPSFSRVVLELSAFGTLRFAQLGIIPQRQTSVNSEPLLKLYLIIH